MAGSAFDRQGIEQGARQGAGAGDDVAVLSGRFQRPISKIRFPRSDFKDPISKILISKILAQPFAASGQRAKPQCDPANRLSLQNPRQRTGVVRILAADLDEIVDPVTRLKHRYAIRIRHDASLTDGERGFESLDNSEAQSKDVSP
jgi:hypothetical protein